MVKGKVVVNPKVSKIKGAKLKGDSSSPKRRGLPTGSGGNTSLFVETSGSTTSDSKKRSAEELLGPGDLFKKARIEDMDCEATIDSPSPLLAVAEGVQRRQAQ